MSVHVMSRVWDESSLSGGPLLTLIALADSAGADGIVWWSEEKLAEKVRRSVRQVRRDLRMAEEAGELEIRKARRRGSRTWFNVYRFKWYEYEIEPRAFPFKLQSPFTTGQDVRSSDKGTTGHHGSERPDTGVRLNVREPEVVPAVYERSTRDVENAAGEVIGKTSKPATKETVKEVLSGNRELLRDV